MLNYIAAHDHLALFIVDQFGKSGFTRLVLGILAAFGIIFIREAKLVYHRLAYRAGCGLQGLYGFRG
ncbi:hypothetical protein D3C72_1754480 [compost metagenome]